MISKKMLGVFVLSMAISSAAYTQNLLNVQEWLPGSGGTTSFIMNGSVGENSREWGVSPYGQRAVLWKATPAVNNDGDGGWNTTPVSINNQQMYRLSVWVKKTVSNSGTTYLGCDNVNRLDGTYQDNPYFWWGDLPQLDKWYLLVAYIHGNGDTNCTLWRDLRWCYGDQGVELY
ncbi:MAG TPA: hypothetical protein VL943_03300 [Niabella sp.]|nr:hypothetical protein [Niabella sp.]